MQKEGFAEGHYQSNLDLIKVDMKKIKTSETF